MKGLDRLQRKIDNLHKLNVEKFMYEAGKIIVADVTTHIQYQREINDVKQLKRNKPSTIKRKGHDKSLIDKGLLVSKATYNIRANKYGVKVWLKNIRRDVGKYVQQKGYNFWGISPSGAKVILKKWRKLIKKWLMS